MITHTTRPLRLLCIHQGAELYGSDRSFLQCVEALRIGWPNAHIRVVLAADGPLRHRLSEVSDEVVVRDLLVLRLSKPLSTILKIIVGLPHYFLSARQDMALADVTYINTVVIADYTLAAATLRLKPVIHAREIPKQHAIKLIRGLLRMAGAHMIYNSIATRKALAQPDQSSAVIYNGFEPVAAAAAPELLTDGFSTTRPLRIAMLGRINDWKGQDVLVGAAALLSPDHRARVRIRIIGSTYGKVTGPLDALKKQIAAAGLEDVVVLEPFMEDPSEAYRWADLCAMPSRRPEPFGRVAIESMAHGRAVLAAAHGGLIEIVEDGRSGWLLPPGDKAALAAAIREVLATPVLITRYGAAALERFNKAFTSAAMAQNLKGFFDDILSNRT